MQQENKKQDSGTDSGSNDQTQLRAGEVNENLAADRSALADAPCSALSDRLLGQSDIESIPSPEWDKIAESNSESLKELTKK